MLPQALCIISYPLVNSNWSYNPETPNLGQIRWLLELCDLEIWQMTLNKANLRDLIAATSLVILLKLDQNGGFFACVTLKFDWWPRKNNKARLLYYIKLCVSFQISEFKLELQSENAQSGSNSMISWALWPAIWCMTLKKRAPLLCYFKLCASFRSHQWFQTGDTVRKRPIWVKIDNFFSCLTLKFDVWPWKNNKAPVLCHFKLCASFRSHWCIQTWVTVRKRPIWVKFDDF